MLNLQEGSGSHFHAACWKCRRLGRAAISAFPRPFPRTCRAGTDRVDIAGGSSGLRPGSNERRIFRVPKDLPSRIC